MDRAEDMDEEEWGRMSQAGDEVCMLVVDVVEVVESRESERDMATEVGCGCVGMLEVGELKKYILIVVMSE